MSYQTAIVGCGRIAEKHAEALQRLQEAGLVRLLGVCDPVAERADAMAKTLNTGAFTDLVDMMTTIKPDWVSICTPSGLHPALGRTIAEHGCHVVSEKPLGTDLADVDHLIQTCDQNNVKLFCVKQVRLHPTMQLLKRAIDKGRFGKIYFAQSNVFWQRPQSYFDVAPWRGTRKMDGGILLNQASHYVDALYWLLGEVRHVTATQATLARKIESEDTISCTMQFANGAVGNINVTMLTYPKNLEGTITILGEKGTVRIGGTGVNRVDHWEFAEWDDDDKLVEQHGSDLFAVWDRSKIGHEGYYRHVIDVLDGHCDPDVDGSVARKSMEIVLAVYRAAERHQVIDLPL